MLQVGAMDLRALYKQFINAVINGDIQEVEKFLADGRIDLAIVYWWEIIRQAVRYERIEIIKLLLAHPGVTAKDIPCYYAASRGHIDIVRLFLTDPRVDPFSVQYDNDAFLGAIENGQTEVVKLFLADPRSEPMEYTWSERKEYTTVIELAAKHGHLDIIILLLADPALLAYMCEKENLRDFINKYPAVRKALTRWYPEFNAPFRNEFFSLISKEFLAKSPYYIAALHANGITNDLIALNIAPHMHPFFKFYKEIIMEEGKSYDSTNLINQSCQLLPMYNKQKRQDDGVNEELDFRALKKPRLESNEMEVIDNDRVKGNAFL